MMAGKGKKRRKASPPTLKIRRFDDQKAAEDYAEKTTERLGKKDFGTSSPRGEKGVTVLRGVKKPAVLVVTPRGKIPKLPKVRITAKRPKIG